MRYSKRDRELAARVCSIVACYEAAGQQTGYCDMAREICHSALQAGRVAKLAFDAWREVPDDRIPLDMHEHDAWAEALIRTGWCPP